MALNINLKFIDNQKGNALFLACGIVSAIIIIFWLMPQFAYNTIYLYFRGIEQVSLDKVTVDKANSIEDEKRLLSLDSKILYTPVWEIDASNLKLKCEQSKVSRQALNFKLNSIKREHRSKFLIWGIDSQQSQYFEQLMNLSGLDFYCQAESKNSLSLRGELLIQMARNLSLLREQLDFDQLHIKRSSYLTRPARTQLYALDTIEDFEFMKQKDIQVQLKKWRDWLDTERNILRQFSSGFNSHWIPGDLHRLLILRNDRWLGLWDEIKFKELLQGLSFRRDLYGSLLAYTQQLVEGSNFNPNEIKSVERKVMQKLNEKFKANLNTSRGERFLDFLIAPRGFDRRLRHRCFRDLSVDLQNDIINGVRWQLRLIARIEYAIERIERL